MIGFAARGALDEDTGLLGNLRAAALLAAFVFTTILIIPPQWLAVRYGWPYMKTLPLWYFRLICRIVGIRVRVAGNPVTDSGVLIAANHTSWLDMPVLGACVPLSFVAKSEVRTWPFFGLCAQINRTVFVERSARVKTGEQRDEIAARIKGGDAIVLFPEGTSSDGNRVLTFNSALLGAAQMKIPANGGERDVPVQPVSVAYTRLHGMPMGREFRPFFAWYGDMDLVPHLWEAFALGPIDVLVEFHKPLTVTECGGRKALAQEAQRVITQAVIAALNGNVAQPPPVAKKR